MFALRRCRQHHHRVGDSNDEATQRDRASKAMDLKKKNEKKVLHEIEAARCSRALLEAKGTSSMERSALSSFMMREGMLCNCASSAAGGNVC